MKQFISFLKKEFYHITRDRLTLTIMLLLPVVMLFILGYAISMDMKNISFVVLDKAKSTYSNQLVEKLAHNSYFQLDSYLNTTAEVESAFRKDGTKLALIIPNSFDSDLLRGNASLQIVLDASNPNEARTIENYVQMLVQQFMREKANSNIKPLPVNMEVKMLYNPQMKSSYNIVPGIIGLLMIIICALMTSISVVREKEMGTMEILLASPLKPSTIILAKSLPYFMVGIVDNILVLALSYYVLQVPIAGNIFLVLLLDFTFTFCALALGLLISSITNTQQSAMIATGAGLMLPSMLLSGMIFPISSMPDILQWVSCLNPTRWFVDAVRNVMIKGVGLEAIWKELLILLGMTVTLLTVSIKKFKNRL